MINSGKFILSLLFFSLAFCPDLFADKVKTVFQDGTMELESGERFRFEGIELAPESIKMLPILLANQEVRVESKSKKRGYIHEDKTSGISDAFVYVKTNEIIFSEYHDQMTDKKYTMVNEFLIQIGAAKVLADYQGSKLNDFVRIQEDARSTGAGVWSYNLATDF